MGISDKRASIGKIYSALMTQVVARVDAMGANLDEIKSDLNDSENWRRFEFCYLQMRLVCEYTALAVLAAHQEYSETDNKNLSKEWHAASLIEKVARINPHGFPIPVVMLMDHHAPGHHHVEPAESCLEPKEIAKFYGEAGDRLHVGSLGKIVKGRLPPYSVNHIVDFRNRIIRTLNSHMIRLPHIGSVLLVHLKDKSDGLVHCAFGDAEGPFLMDGTIFNVEQVQ